MPIPHTAPFTPGSAAISRIGRFYITRELMRKESVGPAEGSGAKPAHHGLYCRGLSAVKTWPFKVFINDVSSGGTPSGAACARSA